MQYHNSTSDSFWWPSAHVLHECVNLEGMPIFLDFIIFKIINFEGCGLAYI